MSGVDAIISTKDLKVLLKPNGWFTTDRDFCNSYCESVVEEEVVAFPAQMWEEWWSSTVYNKGPTHYDPITYPFIAIPMNVERNHWILAIVAYASDLIGDDQALCGQRLSYWTQSGIHSKSRQQNSCSWLLSSLSGISRPKRVNKRGLPIRSGESYKYVYPRYRIKERTMVAGSGSVCSWIRSEWPINAWA